MTRAIAAVGLAFLAGLSVLGADRQGGTVLYDGQFRLLASDDERQIGRWKTKAVVYEAERQIEITETLSTEYRGKPVSYTATVIYSTESAPAPISGVTETVVDGKTSMKGTVKVGERSISYQGSGLLNMRTGDTIAPPKAFEGVLERPDGPILFQSALPAIAPKLLPQAGELKNVAFAEFPDDLGAPELFNLKLGCRLVRQAPRADGGYVIKLCGDAQEDIVLSQIRYDRDNRLVAVESRGKMKAVPAESVTQLATASSAPTTSPAR